MENRNLFLKLLFCKTRFVLNIFKCKFYHFGLAFSNWLWYKSISMNFKLVSIFCTLFVPVTIRDHRWVCRSSTELQIGVMMATAIIRIITIGNNRRFQQKAHKLINLSCFRNRPNIEWWRRVKTPSSPERMFVNIYFLSVNLFQSYVPLFEERALWNGRYKG